LSNRDVISDETPGKQGHVNNASSLHGQGPPTSKRKVGMLRRTSPQKRIMETIGGVVFVFEQSSKRH